MRSFRSVGTTSSEYVNQQQAVAPTPIPIGIVTPLNIGNNSEGLLAMNYNVGVQMKNNLRDLLMTNWGERLALYDYGANLTPLLTELETRGKEAFDNLAMQRIMTAVQKYMPYVELQGFDSNTEYSESLGVATIKIIVEYTISRANISTTRLEVVFNVI